MKSIQRVQLVEQRAPAGKKVNVASLNVKPRIRRLGRFLRKSSEANSGAHLIEIGDFRIDLDNRSMRIRDREISLSPEEFDLLVYMAHTLRESLPRTRSSAHGAATIRCAKLKCCQLCSV